MSTAPVDPSRCPLCGEANACGMVEGKSTCWCFDLAIPRSVLARVPPEAQGVACVCQRCATAASESASKV